MGSKLDPRCILRCPLSSNLCHRGRDEQLAVNPITAANCASILRPGGPVYFASHSKTVVGAMKNHATKENRTISTFDSLEALHIDKTEDWESRPPSDSYSVFVDEFLTVNCRCVTHCLGGFRRENLLLSYDATCERNVPRRKPACFRIGKGSSCIEHLFLIHRWYNNSMLILIIRNTRSSNDLASRLGYSARLF
jgi:hypothetical protein